MDDDRIYLALACKYRLLAEAEASALSIRKDAEPNISLKNELADLLDGQDMEILEGVVAKYRGESQDALDQTRAAHGGRPPRRDSDDPRPVRTSSPEWISSRDRVSDEQAGRYKLIEEQGRGAIGRILLAYDEYIGRDVAIKELLGTGGTPLGRDRDDRIQSRAASPATVDRFLKEARISGQLQHPSIIPVYDIGRRANGDYFYTMKLVRGKTLLEAIKQASSLEEGLKLLPHFWDLCNALAFAHSRNVIHRDIKPSNVMIGEFGETVVLDWGLAKVLGEVDEKFDELEKGMLLLLDTQDGKTVAGSALGTPAYMSPEQADGTIDDIDQLSDVYALGAVLYHILTGHPPYTGKSSFEVIQKVRDGKPIQPFEKEDHPPPRELAAIAEKALSRDKANRYQSSAELVQEIEAYMSGEKVAVYEYTSFELLRRFAEKNKAAVSAGTAMFVVLIIAFVVTFNAYKQMSSAYLATDSALKRETAATRSSHYHMAQALVRESEKLIADKRLGEASIYAAASLVHNPSHASSPYFTPEFAPQYPQSLQFRALAASQIYTADNGIAMHLESLLSTKEPKEIAYSPGGDLLAISGSDKKIKLWKLGTKAEIVSLEGHTASVYSVAFSPNGRKLVSGSDDQTVRIWDIRTGKQLNVLSGHEKRVYNVVFSPSGQHVVSGSADKTIRIWDIETGENIKVITGHGDLVSKLAFSPDGTLLASGSADKTIRLWDFASGELRHILSGHTDGVWGLAFSPDGAQFASGSYDKTVRLWNARNGQLMATLDGHQDEVNSVDFSADGRFLASASLDGIVKIWRTETRENIYTQRVHRGFLWNVDFSPKGYQLASGGYDKTVKIWNVELEPKHRILRGHSDTVFGAMFTADGKSLVSSSFDKTIRVWDAASEKELRRIEGHDDIILGIGISPDGKTIASGGFDRTVRLWQLETGKEIKRLLGHQHNVFATTFSPDGGLLASSSYDKIIKLWDVKTGTEIRSLSGHQDTVWNTIFSPDGKRLASASYDNSVKIWNVDTGEELTALPHEDWVSGIVFSGDGRHLYTGTKNGRILLWDIDKGHTQFEFKGHTQWVYHLALTPDERYLASCSGDQSVRIWDIETGKPLFIFDTRLCYRISFSKDGRHVAFGDKDTVKILPLDFSLLSEDPATLLKRFERAAGMKLDGFLLEMNSPKSM